MVFSSPHKLQTKWHYLHWLEKDPEKGELCSTVMNLKMLGWALLSVEVC
jgi:hypothetical protein